MDEQVDVVGHEDVGENGEAVFLGGLVYSFCEGTTNSVV